MTEICECEDKKLDHRQKYYKCQGDDGYMYYECKKEGCTCKEFNEIESVTISLREFNKLKEIEKRCT